MIALNELLKLPQSARTVPLASAVETVEMLLSADITILYCNQIDVLTLSDAEAYCKFIEE